MYEKAIELVPDQLSAWYSLGATLAQNGRLEEAIEKFKHILQYIDPSDMQTYKSLYQATSMLKAQGGGAS